MSIAAWAHREIYRASRADVYAGLDGVRAIAALMVLTAHTFLSFPAFGGTGVWLFFVLSGFLLFPGLPQSPAELREPVRIVGYLIRRVFRMLPLYFVAAIPLSYVLQATVPDHLDWPWIFEHWTLQRADSVFWTVKTELVFYVMLPFVAAAVAFVPKQGKALALLVIAVAYWWYIQIPYRWMIAAGGPAGMPLMAFPFFLGAALSQMRPWTPRWLALPLLVVGFVGLFAASALPGNLGWEYPGTSSLFAGAVVLGASIRPTRVLDNPVLRTMGVVGYSFYIWHVFVGAQERIFWIRLIGYLPSNGVLYVESIVLTTALAIVTYLLIERPGMALGRWVARALPRVSFAPREPLTLPSQPVVSASES
jgi:peptidoglycan/LPS O-acetylase OafA/YrhL